MPQDAGQKRADRLKQYNNFSGIARIDLQFNCRLCSSAAEEWTVVPSVSCMVAQPYSELKIARAIAAIAASTPLRALASPAVHPQHRPVRLINRHSEDAGRIRPLRGFLPRGLFNACPHALSLAHELVVEGRRRTNLNDEQT
jgi:hypothetical protein